MCISLVYIVWLYYNSRRKKHKIVVSCVEVELV
jgi:hypothetical protein